MPVVRRRIQRVVKPPRPKALPTLVYRYGCSPPLEELDAVQDQWFYANRYRNQLVEIELRRRTASEAIIGESSEQLADVNAKINDLTGQIAALVTEKKQRNSAARRRSRHEDLNRQITSLKQSRKVLYQQRKELRLDQYASPENAASLLAVNAMAAAERKAARKLASREWGLYYGTYLLVEDAAKSMGKGTPPKFRSFRRSDGGTIGVQIATRAGEQHLTVDRLYAGANKSVLLEPEPVLANVSNRRRHRPYVLVKLCIGGQDSKRVIGLSNPRRYVTVRMSLHRPLPVGSHITWVRLVARPLGTKLKWEVHFTVARDYEFTPETADGFVGIDIGWRKGDGQRVAYWAGNDGQHGELRLPADLVAAIKHKSDLQAIRDQRFDIMKSGLVAWLATAIVPEWLKDATATLVKWRSQRRLHDLEYKWRSQRFDGDVGSYTSLVEWHKQDYHLLEWLANESQRARNRRKDMYGKFVAELRRHYGTVGLEDIDLRAMARKDDVHRNYQVQRSLADLSTLRTMLADGLKVVDVPPAYTSQTCHCCGVRNQIGANMTYQCSDCGWHGDRDYNGAMNILRAAQCRENGREPSTYTVPALTSSSSREEIISV